MKLLRRYNMEFSKKIGLVAFIFAIILFAVLINNNTHNKQSHTTSKIVHIQQAINP